MTDLQKGNRCDKLESAYFSMGKSKLLGMAYYDLRKVLEWCKVRTLTGRYQEHVLRKLKLSWVTNLQIDWMNQTDKHVAEK